ncbi:programmed cell death protein 5 [Lepeophtheirus salmonis]|uniref:Programmed cell death protein 5 n=2 Tax=Lepeophtheirus salmonis TaxID=72036 RepID=C1BS58_LEPSM|nr:programmed cell death protein 5-like [Lepeophtheirus salmonis]ACO11861.1 Programmed cell death protein 5 [Lepeophtheirus salmonis]
MEDDELAAIRAKRMAEMQAQSGSSQDGAKKAQEQQNAMEDMKNSVLSQVLSQEARARLNTLSLAKPEKGQRIESAIIQMARTGKIAGKLSENDLIGLLQRFSGSTVETKVKFDRRRAALDSDED